MLLRIDFLSRESVADRSGLGFRDVVVQQPESHLEEREGHRS